MLPLSPFQLHLHLLSISYRMQKYAVDESNLIVLFLNAVFSSGSGFDTIVYLIVYVGEHIFIPILVTVVGTVVGMVVYAWLKSNLKHSK